MKKIASRQFGELIKTKITKLLDLKLTETEAAKLYRFLDFYCEIEKRNLEFAKRVVKLYPGAYSLGYTSHITSRLSVLEWMTKNLCQHIGFKTK